MSSPGQIREMLPVFLAGYAKRWLDVEVYDRIPATQLGQDARQLPTPVKYGIEAGLNLLTAFFDRSLAGDGVLRKFVREVALDVGPEMSKRLLNETRKRVEAAAWRPEESKAFNHLLALDDRSLIMILDWLYESSSADRTAIVGAMASLEKEEVLRLATLDPATVKRVLGLARVGAPEEGGSRFIRDLNSRWRIWLERHGA